MHGELQGNDGEEDGRPRGGERHGVGYGGRAVAEHPVPVDAGVCRLGCRKELEVRRQGKTHVVVRAADRLSMRLPRRRADVDGPEPGNDSRGEAIFTAECLHEFATLFEALTRGPVNERAELREVRETAVH
jgi:hypothetical protein